MSSDRTGILFVAGVLIMILMTSSCTEQMSPVAYVDPFIGTGGHGHTYPGPSMPFGMIQPGPDTRLTGWDGCSGYHYSDSIIYGFSQTHLSGTGIPDYCDILIMPGTGKPLLHQGTPDHPASGYPSRFFHDRETAKPGYYAVMLQDDDILAEVTVAARTALYRFTPDNSGDSLWLVLDLEHRDKVLDSWIRITGDSSVVGYRRSTGWARDQRVWFSMKFSRPFKGSGVTDHDTVINRVDLIQGTGLKAWFTFPPGKPLLVRVSISPVDDQGARRNGVAEIPSWNFDSVRTAASQAWNDQLNKIKVYGGSNDDKVKFYTALYHASLNPNLYSDVDGRYRGHDSLVHRLDSGHYYTLFSLWDTFRGEHPLLNILEPDRTRDFIRTFLLMYRQGGLLPVWELSANETHTMIGYHSIPVITDAWRKGIRGFDGQEALEAMVHSADEDREGLKYYRSRGYISVEDESESVSKTLEYAYDDWCIATMAKMLGDTAVYNRFIRRAQYYKNLFDPQSGFMRGRVNGGWFSPFDPREVNFNYTEANAWQYTFFVPQDISGLIRLMGGEQAFISKLDTLFHTTSVTTGRQQADITGMIGQYAHGNEPSHHIAYLYNYVGQPWKTQDLVRQIMNTQYRTTPDGLSGNEDAGQMSAWFVLSSMGFYPVTPGTDQYILGSPLFKRVVIQTARGHKFTIRAPKNRTNHPYVVSATLNHKTLDRTWFSHEELMGGGTLDLAMSAKPSSGFGVPQESRPVTEITDGLILPVPWFTAQQRTFYDSLVVGVGLTEPAKIRIAFNGADPLTQGDELNGNFVLRETTHVRCIALDDKGRTSFPVAGDFMKIPRGRTVKYLSEYSPQYSAGGDLALVDFIRGPANFRNGSWQGFEGVDFEAVVDLGKNQKFDYIGIGFLQDVGSWIFMPEYVEFFVSWDGQTFTPVGKVVNDISERELKPVTREFYVHVYPKEMRYVKVYAKNRKVCPSWHPGAGGKAWLFADEIVIR